MAHGIVLLYKQAAQKQHEKLPRSALMSTITGQPEKGVQNATPLKTN